MATKNKEKKTMLISFKTTPELRAKIEEKADEEDRTISSVINRILIQYFEEHKKTKIE